MRLRVCAAFVLVVGGVDVERVVAEPPYTEVPAVACANPEVFRSVLQASQSRCVRVIVLGDSQETCPGGWGAHYIPHLNAVFARSFGPASESILFEPEWWWSEPSWLGTSAVFNPSAEAPQVAESSLLPGMTARVLAGPAASATTFASVFLPEASACVSEELRLTPWCTGVEGVVAEVLVARRAASSQLAWSFAPTPASSPDASASQTLAEGEWEIPARAGKTDLQWVSTPLLSIPSGLHAQVRLSSGDGLPVDCLGVRYRSGSAAHGIVVQGLSKGGMRIGDFIDDFAGSGEALRAIDPSIVVLHWGANDAGLTSVPEWRANLMKVIATLRAESGDPLLPIIIAGDPPRNGITADAPFHEFPAVAAEVALSDPALLALNLRRVEEECFGWDAELNLGSADGVHYLPHGQRMLAHAFVGTLLEGIGLPMSGVDAGRSWREVFYPLGAACTVSFPCHAVVEVEATRAGVPWTLGADCSDADDDGAPDICIQPGSPDINGDGIVSGADLTQLLSAWGTSDPAADCSNDGIVGGADLSLVLSAWGTAG